MEKIKTLSIDIETFSDEELKKSGVYKYSQSPEFEILLFGVSINDEKVKVYDLACKEKVPEEILNALTDDSVLKWAFNASFERICISEWMKRNCPEYFKPYRTQDGKNSDYLSPVSWRCSMVWSAYMGLPFALSDVGSVLKLKNQKLKEGKDLIRYFSMPCRATKANGGRTRNYPKDAPDKWDLFKSYNRRDVEVELAIKDKLRNFPVPGFIWEEYHLSEKINDTGILLDMEVVENASDFDKKSKSEILKKMKAMTQLENPNSVLQMKKWLSNQGHEMESLGKKEVQKEIGLASPEIQDVLLLRQKLAKSSVKKYQAMKKVACKDKRARGMFQFYGASRTGRFAGRIIQLQNLPQNHMADLKSARELVRDGNYDALKLLYEDIPDTLSQLIRTAFIPRGGMKFIVSDFSAIEARVLSHMAGENWRMEVFKQNGDIYCASASAMFHVPVEKHGENAHLRQKGKIAELALGYGGSVGALKAMGATLMGLSEEELKPLVDSWRNANPNITRLWWDVDRCVKDAVRNRKETETHGIKFIYKSKILFIELLSGRSLAYVKPEICENMFAGESVSYEGISSSKKWGRIESYGPKFVENIVQAVSRDILVYAMRNLSDYRIVGHVHDEVILECEKDISVSDITKKMSKTPPWIPGLILNADGYECGFYKKD